MAFSSQPNFTAEIDGTTVHELNKKIDYTKVHLTDRMKAVQELLDSTDFYIDYFAEFFNPNINAGDSLSADVNICKSLERMANYILNSKEVKEEEDAMKTKYVFHTDRKYFEKKLARETSISQVVGTNTPEEESNIMHFLKTEEPNYRKGKIQKVTAKDIARDDKLGEILRSYNNLLVFVDQELRDKNSKYNRYLLTKTKGAVVEDMIYCKDHLLGVWGYDLKNFYESCEPDYSVFDFTNVEHIKGKKLQFTDHKGKDKELFVKGLMYFEPRLMPNDEFSLTLMDFENTVNQAELNPNERFVLDRVRMNQSKFEIAEELKVSAPNVSYLIDQIAIKISKVGNKYDLELAA